MKISVCINSSLKLLELIARFIHKTIHEKHRVRLKDLFPKLSLDMYNSKIDKWKAKIFGEETGLFDNFLWLIRLVLRSRTFPKQDTGKTEKTALPVTWHPAEWWRFLGCLCLCSGDSQSPGFLQSQQTDQDYFISQLNSTRQNAILILIVIIQSFNSPLDVKNTDISSYIQTWQNGYKRTTIPASYS